jgi:hypothetical protein
MNAAEIGELGGGVIWTLTSIGSGGGDADKLMKIAAKLKSVEEEATAMAAYLEQKQKAGPVTWEQLSADNDFWILASKLAAAIAGAVAAGVTNQEGAGQAVKKALELFASGMKLAEVTAKVGKIIEILQSEKTAAEKDREAGKIVGELIHDAFAFVGEKAHEHDEAKKQEAERREHEKQQEESDQEIEVLSSTGKGDLGSEAAPTELPADAPLELESTLESLGGLQAAVDQAKGREPIELPPEAPLELQTALESSSDLQAAFEGSGGAAAIELPPDEPMQLQSAAESTQDLQNEANTDPRTQAQQNRALDLPRVQQSRRWILTREDELNYIQYSPDVNPKAGWRSAYRFTPPRGGGTVRFGPREYTYDANGNLVQATTTGITLGVRDPVMYGGSPRPGTDYAHLLGIDFGTIDAQVGRHGGFAGDPAMNRPLGEVDPLWYEAERRTLDSALNLRDAGRPFRVVAEARGHDAHGVPSETRLRLESNGTVVEDSGWIPNSASANKPSARGHIQ